MKLNPFVLAVLAVPSLAFPLPGMGAPANNPLFLTSKVTPNIFFQVDDSGSMDWTILTKKYWHSCAYDPDYGSSNNDSTDCDGIRSDGNFRSYDDDHNTSDTFHYVYDTSDDVYSNGCGDTYPAVENCTSGKRPWDTDWRVRSAAMNVLYYDPAVTYAPWPGMSNASFTAARSNPQSGEAGYTSTRDLTNMIFEVWIDDSGYSGTRPRRGTNRNKTTGANGWVDLWDSHYTVKLTSSGAEITTTTYTPTNTDLGASVSSVTSLGGSGTHAALGTLTVDQVKQGFANWYQYHRRRSFVAKAAISQVITDTPDYRYGLSVLNNYTSLFKQMPAASVTNYASHNSTLISDFFKYDWQSNGTPLRRGLERVGKYYENTLGASYPTPITHSCQQNFTILFTDGYWNGSDPAAAIGNSDGDGHSLTLADVAHYYYKTDLSSTLANNVFTTPFDTAKHQHMVTFGVAFGVEGNLVDTDADGWPNPVLTESGNWGNPSSGDPQKIDDLWHASYNSRGEFIAAQSPSELVSALQKALASIKARAGSAAAAATNSTSLDTGSRIFQARFSSEDWSGQLRSFSISTKAVIAPTAEWDAGALINTQVGASTDTRKIITKDAADGVAFDYSVLTAAQKAYLDADGGGITDGRGLDRVGYLRGHSQHEGTTTTPATFRKRPISVLGDIVSSNPWYVGAPSAGYSDVDHPGYSSFRNTYLTRKPVAYVGANDGMLHGFDSSIVWDPNVDTDPAVDSDGDGDFSNDSDGAYVETSSSGLEVLAYVPTPVYQNLSKLTDQNYNANHRYFVDGSPMVADVCVANCGASTATWKSVLVGSLGAGGKGFFALNVTNPAGATSTAAAPTFSEANAASILLWEFTDSDDADLGLTYNYPPSHPLTQQAKQIVKMENDKWAVVLGNGYYSTDGKAVLYVLFLEDGEDGVWSAGDFVKIIADNTVYASNGNGLSTPVPFDSDGNGKADTIYAGDLKGNLWKFNVSAASAASWGVAFSGAPLYVAQDTASPVNSQPIITPPEVTLHPSGGQMVLFGTGKYMETTDNATTATQSFYGVWDNNSAVGGGRSSLNQKLITTSTINGNDYRVISAGAVATSPKGWYIDFPAGERVTGIPKLANGLIFYNTFIPAANACDIDTAGWLMVQTYLTGDLPVFPVFDTNGDGEIDNNDTAVSGLNVGAAIGGTTLIRGAAGSTKGAGVSSLTSGDTSSEEVEFGAGSRGRITWREIIQQ